MSAKAFIDSNIVLYLLSADVAKADRAEAVVAAGGVVSVQVLNEVTNVARRKLGMAWAETDDLLAGLRSACSVEPLTLRTHDAGRRLAERYGLSTWDAMIASAALLAGCDTLFSEDMQHGLLLERQLRVCNPFIAPS
ncbi:MAG TPA: PIN domain-containing protein [Rhodanobacter sp.]|jgi:predicted nucleic acid-binding protein|nr:PIN domain-containing protein [Rhodanobacter sp.]